MRKSYVITILFVLLSLLIAGCSNNVTTNENNKAESETETKAEEIVNYLENYNQFGNKSTEEIAKDIEEHTESKFIGDTGSGDYVLAFERQDGISFSVIGIPFQSCTVTVNDKEYKYEFNKTDS